jgi:hypothetical protein
MNLASAIAESMSCPASIRAARFTPPLPRFRERGSDFLW